LRFELISKITKIETIAFKHSINILPFLQQKYEKGRWKKLKGIAEVRLHDFIPNRSRYYI